MNNPFLHDKRVQELSALAQKLGAVREFSDVVDAEGHQYVDLVMEGGGVLGIGLVGFTYILEQAGVRFLSIAGTSAGSINAALLAAAGTKDEARSGKVAERLAAAKLGTFVDGDSDARDFVAALQSDAGPVKLTWKALQVVDTLSSQWGLCKGDAFRSWLDKELASFGVHTWADLRARMQQSPSKLALRDGSAPTPEQVASDFVVVTAEVTTETKVLLPQMAELFWKDPDAQSPGAFVRASMSIPYFFEPVKLKRWATTEDARVLWRSLARYDGDAPQTAVLVDGGIISNFPINLFHAPGVPTAPTFGVRLCAKMRKPQSVTGPGSLGLAVFNSARHSLDLDFLTNNPDYRHLIGYIDPEGFDWLDFEMPQPKQVALFTKGAEAALNFLYGFDWKKYKAVRKHLAAARAEAEQPS